MKLGMVLRFPGETGIDMAPVLEAERLGYDVVWVGEAYGSDAVSPVSWILAQTTRIHAGTGIMQGVRHAGPIEVRASAPGGSDSIVSDTSAPREPPRSKLGIIDAQPASSVAPAMTLTRTKRNMTMYHPFGARPGGPPRRTLGVPPNRRNEKR